LFEVLDSLEGKGAIDIIRRNRRAGIIFINKDLIITGIPKKNQA
jgi:hypothetical protein